MKKISIIACMLTLIIATSCADYNRVVKTQDYEYKYEVAKQYYAEGMYNRAALLIQDVFLYSKVPTKAKNHSTYRDFAT